MTGGMRTFVVIWFGQFVSMLGTGLTSFALAVYVYTANRSVTEFSFILLANMLPGMLLSPIAGALVDRWSRKWVLVVSDFGAALCTLGILAIVLFGELQVWHVYVMTMLIATLNAFQSPAYSASVTLLVSRENLSRAAGMGELSSAVSQLSTPILGGALLGILQLKGVIAIDLITFLIATATLILVRIPQAQASKIGHLARGNLFQEAAVGWTFIRDRKGLRGLLTLFAATNFLKGTVTVLATPMILSFASEKALGALLTVGGLGMLFGSLLVTTWRGPRRLVLGILGAQLISALALCLAGFRESMVLLGACMFAYLFASPIVAAFSQAIWQRKVPADIQGRVFAVRRLIAWSTTPVAYLLAGPLSDGFFEPLMAPGGGLADSVGRWIGTGPGRGMGLMFILMGAATVLVTLFFASNRSLRSVEVTVEDAQ